MSHKALWQFAILLLTVCIFALNGGCSSNSALKDRTPGDSSPTIAELKTHLSAEFARLGIDPLRVVATAPSGPENAVFDLDAYLLEVNPGDPPTGIELAWTERAIGDYDQNGEVNIADLSGLGMEFGDSVDYEPAADHGGLSWFPTGDPDDDGGVAAGQPPADDSGAANWRLARVDGDGNGELNIADLTPIASHWNQRTTGYRVYRMAPGETTFSLLPNPDEPTAPFTISRDDTFPDNSSSADPNRPVRYYFEDPLQVAGDYTYYVAPFDSSDNSEGTSSSQVVFAYPGTGPQAPIVVLTPNPASGDVPFSMTWDASGSSDADGTIAKFEWDMDQDPSTFEWDSGTDHLLLMTYNTPAEHLMTVRVTDNDGLSTVGNATTIATQAGNFPPVAVLSANPPNALTGELVTWDAAASSDQDGAIVKYEWDMDGDPTTFEYDSGTDPTLQVTFTAIGTHDQLVRVTDDGGLTDQVYGTCVVTAGANTPPTAALAATPPGGAAPLMMQWDASGSTDPDGTIDLYEWDEGGDGTFDYDTGKNPTTPGNYLMAGNYDMIVRVTDNLGGTSTASAQTVATASWYIDTVDSAGDTGNAPSLAFVDSGLLGIAYYAVTNAPTIEQELRFVLGDSFGSNWGTPTWLIKGARLSNSPSLTWMPTNSFAGITWVDNGNHKTYFQSSVLPFTVWQGPFEVHAEGLWESAVLEVMGKPAAFTYNDASKQSSFETAVDWNGTDWTGTGYYVNGTIVAGGYEVSAALVDGNPAVAYWDKNNGYIGYSRSTDTAGSVWPLESFIDGATGVLVGQGVSLAVIDGSPAVSYYEYTNDIVMFCRASDAQGTTWNSPVVVAAPNTAPLGYATGLVDTVDGPGVFYPDGTSGLMYCQASIADGSSWQPPDVVDNVPGAGYELSSLSLTVDGATALFVAYYENTSGDLKFASFH